LVLPQLAKAMQCSWMKAKRLANICSIRGAVFDNILELNFKLCIKNLSSILTKIDFKLVIWIRIFLTEYGLWLISFAKWSANWGDPWPYKCIKYWYGVQHATHRSRSCGINDSDIFITTKLWKWRIYNFWSETKVVLTPNWSVLAF
jgi:hypothetical protein